MSWAKVGPNIFDKEEVVIVSEIQENMIGAIEVGLKSGHSFKITQNSDHFGEALELWEEFERKAKRPNSNEFKSI